jgi:hypothetical protein
MITLKLQGFQQAKETLLKELEKYSVEGTVTVGIHERNAQRDDGKANNAEIGAYNHYGTDTIPARPWLDVGVESVIRDINRSVGECLKKGDVERALQQMGEIGRGGTYSYLTDLRTPPNAPSTIKKKGSSNPLIDTGALRASIGYEVHKK